MTFCLIFPPLVSKGMGIGQHTAAQILGVDIQLPTAAMRQDAPPWLRRDRTEDESSTEALKLKVQESPDG